MPPVTVTIYGEEYTLSGVDDPRYIVEVAAYLDARMREVGGAGRTLPSSRVAILAALNIADELLRLRDEVKRKDQSLRETLDEINVTLDGILHIHPAP